MPKILVVDDTPANIIAMNAMLDDLDADVVNAKSGAEALNQILDNDFALILLDIQMPQMNGYEVAQIIRNEKSTSHIPIIFVTAIHSGEENQLLAYKTGAVDFIEKPINQPILLAKVKVFLGLFTAKEQLKQEEKNTRATLESISDPILVVRKNAIIYANDSAKLFAQNISLQPHTNIDKLTGFFDFDDKSLQMIEGLIHLSSRSNASMDANHELIFKLANGRKLIYELRVTPLLAFADVSEMVVLVFHDVSESRELSDRLSYLVQHDSLTGLANRRYFDVVFRTAIKRVKRSEKLMGLFIIDLDGFKEINDTLGHFAGDKVLKEASKRILSCLREQDILARVGGDEFCVLIEQAASEDDIFIPINRIIKKMSQKFMISNEQRSLGASIGVTMFGANDERNSEELLSDTDLAMYQAKADGRGCYRVFQSSMREVVHNKIALQMALDKAASEQQFVLYYQPQINIKTGEISGLEALIRWQHPEKGLVAPAEFIDVLENSGSMLEVGQWVIDETCRQLSDWRSKGLDIPCVSVNVSAKQFQQHDFPKLIEKTLNKYQIEPQYLGIEITETLFMHLDNTVEDNIIELSRMGCKISLDDFGTGYSSLSYLIRFPIDVLKIDQVFIQGLLGNTQYQSLVTAIISMAKGFDNMQIIAEGVEEKGQLQSLEMMGCDFYQGYLFSKPVPSVLIEDILRRKIH